MVGATTTASVALGCSAAVGTVGVIALRALPRRSITAHLTVLLGVTVGAVMAGVVVSAKAMFINEHDLSTLLLMVAVAGAVSFGIALWAGRRLAADSMWAAEARERERRLEASRRDVVAWVSHDLRTPLAGLRAMVEALEDGVVSDPATVREYHRRVRVEADRMAGLVDDLFELSRIHAGALRLSLAAVPLCDVVSDAVATAAPMAQAKGVTVQARPDDYGVVRASEAELGRVLANLLVNAVRHTPAEGVVTVSGGADADGGWIAVTDGCGGIPEEDLPQLFDVAFRGAAARTPVSPAAGHHAPGAGLGLAIARGLVEAHHGQIAVCNADGGCRFTVRLPAVSTP